MRLCILVLILLVGREMAEAAEPPERRTIGRLGVAVQLGGFFDLGDPGIELRGWARRVGLSVSLGRHAPDPSDPEFTEVSSEAGEQLTGGVLIALIDAKGRRRVPIKVYGTGGIVHVTQARARFARATPGEDGTVGEAVVEGTTGTGFFAGAGAEIGFAGVPGLAVGSELLFATGGEGWGPGVRFHVRYYVW